MRDNKLLDVINLGDEVFDSAVVPSCVFLSTNLKQTDHEFNFADLRQFKQGLFEIDFNSLIKPFSQRNTLETPGYVFGVNNKIVSILKKVETLSVKIDDIAEEVASGISTGGDKIFRISYNFMLENGFEQQIIHKVLKGREINKYQIEDTNHLLIYTHKKVEIEKYPHILEYLKPFEKQLSGKRETKQGKLPWWCLHWHRYAELFKGKKILIRQTSDKLIAALDTNSFYALNSLLILKLKSETQYNLEFILAILNSKLCDFIYQQITQEEGRVFAEVKPQNIRKLYIPKIEEKDQQPFVALVDQILELKKAGKDTVPLENEIDRLVYRLYDLTAEEINIVEGKEKL